MHERFTDRARKVMQLANQEAQRFNHEYIGTEHILLGLVKEGTGVAANVLKNLDIDLRKIRLATEKFVQTGPDLVTMGKMPQTPAAKNVMKYAIEEAIRLQHNYVGTEHILLGLIHDDPISGVGREVLKSFGLNHDEVRAEVLELLGRKKQDGEKLITEAIGNGKLTLDQLLSIKKEFDDALVEVNILIAVCETQRRIKVPNVKPAEIVASEYGTPLFEPQCVCANPALHDADCKWLAWKRG